jgi:hypothetical protein
VNEQDRYDVVIYEITTRTVESVIGENLLLRTGHYNAERRANTGLERINEHYDVAIVPTGEYKKGDYIDHSYDGEWEQP